MNRKQENYPIYIAFANSKGGVGKSTLAGITASILRYRLGFNLFVVDCDPNQWSIYTLRESEKAIYSASDYKHLESFLAAFKDQKGDGYYDILNATIDNALSVADEKVQAGLQDSENKTVYDLAIFDLPAEKLDERTLNLLLGMNFIVVPIEGDTQSLGASLDFALSLERLKKQIEERAKVDVPLKEVVFVWNKFKPSSRTTLQDVYTERIRSVLGLRVMETRIKDSVEVTRGLQEAKEINEVFRSTVLAPRQYRADKWNFTDFVNELQKSVLKLT